MRDAHVPGLRRQPDAAGELVSPRCARNLAGREEDCGRHVAYVPCGKPAPWTVEPDTDREWHACDAHANEALMDEVQAVRS